ncbi:class E sortase [Streptomyces gardneri]|uniref:class E sortase n=1 Tax=Streptomyces gardneri TaxID=66892 RepID=UPI00099E2AE6|nr:class E sortase [Streptomyces gardneri]QPK45854.1 class E sortase [Streptomyces gardneri]WRK37206.1 class E sortase [Streptomyces venezuelae]
MRDRVRERRERVPVVVQGRGRRRTGARVLWVCAETVVTCGVVVLLLVVHQLWWTNQQARAEAREQVTVLERAWAISPPGGGESPPVEGGVVGEVEDVGEVGEDGESELPGDGDLAGGSAGGGGAVSGRDRARPAVPDSRAFAILRIPRLGLTAPVARGISKRSVLDKGYVGHYPGTAGPGLPGNFALAGHRNTHGEPFRYINRLRPGDEISVRTRARTYTYRVDQVLPRTAPRDVGVVRAVPRSLVKPSYGYDDPGAYLTLTTCTPEFSSAYRLVVWAKLVSTA